MTHCALGLLAAGQQQLRVANQNSLSVAGHEVYIVGGAVRDLLLGIQPRDFDLLTTATLMQVRHGMYCCTGLLHPCKSSHKMHAGQEAVQGGC